MPTLGKLPNLRVLELHEHAFLGNEMVCSAQGFPKLESFSLKYVDLVQLKVEERAMPCLQRLEIHGCFFLDMDPVRLRFNTILAGTQR
ncbi:hypothetical protein V6N13_014247 [Hibiscus sabdariffa]|uniref:Disease resistance R13L4/SHOC-2-like LRR domain-containing protein n=1 Tax=Hibiscus sabdariffa TaxID=183260 RepID=A0ABR2RUN2_9ROSI